MLDENRSTVKGSVANIDDVTDKLKTTVDNLNSITKKMDEGKGTIGKLLNDDETLTNLNDTMKSVKDGVEEFSGTLGRRSTVCSSSSGSAGSTSRAPTAGSTTSRSTPCRRRQRFYRFEIGALPHGKRENIVESTTVTFPDGSQQTISTTGQRYIDQFVLSLQLGYKLHNTILRAGIIESRGGAAIEQTFRADTFRVTGEMWDFSRPDLSGHVKLYTRWNASPNFFVTGGVDELLNPVRDRHSSAGASPGKTRTSSLCSAASRFRQVVVRKAADGLLVHGLRGPEPSVARPLPGVRRVEHARGGAGGRDASPRSDRAVRLRARPAVRRGRSDGPAHPDGRRRLRPRPRRRPRAGLGRPRRRGAGDRQVDAPPPGRRAARRTGRARPLRQGGGVRPAGQDAGRPARRLRAGTVPPRRDLVEAILEAAEAGTFGAVVVDSIQTIASADSPAAAGSVSQVRSCAGRLLAFAKTSGIPVFLIGHVTKDGTLAGPKTLEHLVDAVLSFEGERFHAHRVVRALKNRFGPVHELGVFEMTGAGLVEVANPSSLYLGTGAGARPGSVVLAGVEGTRPLLLEVQALTVEAKYGTPRRTAIGFDGTRLALLLAVLERHGGLSLSSHDVFLNVAGGAESAEPAADLAVCRAVAGSFRGRALPAGTVVFGEVGLLGEVRAVSDVGPEAEGGRFARFHSALVPAGNAAEAAAFPDLSESPAPERRGAAREDLGSRLAARL